jgi:hypothetical protein
MIPGRKRNNPYCPVLESISENFTTGNSHGNGRLIQNDGNVISGTWENGKIIVKKKK